MGVFAEVATAAPFDNIAAPGVGFTSLSELFPQFFSIIMTVGAVVLLFFLFWGAFKYLTAGSNEDNVKKARTTITNAIVGMFLLASAWVLWTVVIDFIPGLPELLGR